MEFIRTLKALADPLRLRVLAAVSEEELTVGEVQEVVASAQPLVSRNLAILREAGFVQARKEGTNVYFSVRENMSELARGLFKSLQLQWSGLAEVKEDKVRLEACRRRRLQRSQNYFESVAGDWERIRKSYFDDRVASMAIETLLPSDLVLADIGCGTGSLTFELARIARRVIGVDLSREMLRQARDRAKQRGVNNIEFRYGDALKLPLESDSVDAAFCVMVLHFLPDPARAIAELRRVTRAAGSIVVVDLVPHGQEWMREEMAHRWLGFDETTVAGWFRQAGMASIDYKPTGRYAGEKMARNGNRPVEIFVARAGVPQTGKARHYGRVK
jgi:ArsR family transcriptional regulator